MAALEEESSLVHPLLATVREGGVCNVTLHAYLLGVSP